MKLAFTVPGYAEPQGSARGFIYKDRVTGKQRVAITSDNPALKQWRAAVALAAKRAVFDSTGQSFPIARGKPVAVELRILQAWPQKGKGIYKATRPDVDKLARGLLDGLTGIIYEDDAQVAKLTAVKLFGTPERAEIEIEEICQTNGNGSLFSSSASTETNCRKPLP